MVSVSLVQSAARLSCLIPHLSETIHIWFKYKKNKLIVETDEKALCNEEG